MYDRPLITVGASHRIAPPEHPAPKTTTLFRAHRKEGQETRDGRAMTNLGD